MTPGGLAYVVVGLVGLCVGSFLNVVVARVPEGESVVRPRSRCPGCGHEIRAPDNVPVLSWFLLRGRCRDCGAPISPRYVVVEAACGLLWVLVLWRFGVTWEALLSGVLVTVLLAVTAVDAATLRIPTPLVLAGAIAGGAVIVGALVATGQWRRGIDALAGGFGAGLFFEALYFLTRGRGIGYGDVRLSYVLGLCLGFLGPRYVVVGFLGAFLTGGVAGVVIAAVQRKGVRGGLKTKVPFGVFLSCGALVALLWAPAVSDWYLRLSG